MSANGSYKKRTLQQNKIQLFAFVISGVICVFFSSYFALSIPAKTVTSYTIIIQDKINPNSASVFSLIRLPGIGITRAMSIVSYRMHYLEQHKGKTAFKSAKDLENVKGIGNKTAENIEEWLTFQ